MSGELGTTDRRTEIESMLSIDAYRERYPDLPQDKLEAVLAHFGEVLSKATVVDYIIVLVDKELKSLRYTLG